MHPRSVLLLIAVLALGAVACETDNPPQPIVEGPSLDAERSAPTITVRPPAHVTPRAVTPTNLAPAPVRPATPRAPVIDHSVAAARPPAVSPPPALAPTASAQQHTPVAPHGQSGSGGVSGVVNKVASPLP